MKLKEIRYNMHTLHLSEKVSLHFSYETLVAVAFGGSFIVNEKYNSGYSDTTSKHISEFAGKNQERVVLTEEEFSSFVDFALQEVIND